MRKRALSRMTRAVSAGLLVLLGAAPTTFAAAEPGRGFFGLTPRIMNDAITVIKVTPGGPAEVAGVAPGDVIVLIAGQRPTPTEEGGLHHVFTRFHEGEEVEVVVRRHGKLEAFQLTLGPVPGPTREDQERIEAVERKVRAARILDEMFATFDTFELSFSETGQLLFRPSANEDWQALEPEVAKKLESPARHFLKRDGGTVLRLKVERGDDGAVALSVVGPGQDPG